MADVKWIKIVTDLFEDDKIGFIESRKDADSILVIWLKLLILAGKLNAKGIFMLDNGQPYTDAVLAQFFHRPIKPVRTAMALFVELGMVDVDDGVYSIPNWEKHQSLEKLEKKRENDRVRKHNKREENKQMIDEAKFKNQNQTESSRGRPSDVAATSESCPQNVAPQNKIENEIKKESEEIPKKQEDPFVSFCVNDFPLLEALAKYEAMRQRIGRPLNEDFKYLLLKKLETFPHEQWIDIVDQATVKGWLDFYPVKNGRNAEQKPKAKNELDAFYSMSADWAKEESA